MIDALRARFRLAMDRLRAESLTTRDWLLVAAAVGTRRLDRAAIAPPPRGRRYRSRRYQRSQR